MGRLALCKVNETTQSVSVRLRKRLSKPKSQNRTTFELTCGSQIAHVWCWAEHSEAIPELPVTWNSPSKRSNAIYLWKYKPFLTSVKLCWDIIQPEYCCTGYFETCCSEPSLPSDAEPSQMSPFTLHQKIQTCPTLPTLSYRVATLICFISFIFPVWSLTWQAMYVTHILFQINA